MKDSLSYAVVSDGEEGFAAALRKFREWLGQLPERAHVRIVVKGTVKEAEEAAELSRTSDMFKAGQVKDGVQRKGRAAENEAPRRRRSRAHLSAVDGQPDTSEE